MKYISLPHQFKFPNNPKYYKKTLMQKVNDIISKSADLPNDYTQVIATEIRPNEWIFKDVIINKLGMIPIEGGFVKETAKAYNDSIDKWIDRPIFAGHESITKELGRIIKAYPIDDKGFAKADIKIFDKDTIELLKKNGSGLSIQASISEHNGEEILEIEPEHLAITDNPVVDEAQIPSEAMQDTEVENSESIQDNKEVENILRQQPLTNIGDDKMKPDNEKIVKSLPIATSPPVGESASGSPDERTSTRTFSKIDIFNNVFQQKLTEKMKISDLIDGGLL